MNSSRQNFPLRNWAKGKSAGAKSKRHQVRTPAQPKLFAEAVLHPADGRQERQARGEREREGAEDEVLVVKGVAERRILGVHELVLA